MARSVPASRARKATLSLPGALGIGQIHACLTALIAPTVLFFAFTGSLQLFSLHEAHAGYRPPSILEKLARLHKDQRFAPAPRHRPSALQTPVAGDAGDWIAPAVQPAQRSGESSSRSAVAIRWLFLLAAVALMLSTLLGLWMALTQNRQKGLLLMLFLAGYAAPVAALWL